MSRARAIAVKLDGIRRQMIATRNDHASLAGMDRPSYLYHAECVRALDRKIAALASAVDFLLEQRDAA